MTPFIQMIIYTTGAGACIVLGALLARIKRVRPNWIESELKHFIIAFGGGAVLAALALVLLPQGLSHIHNPFAAVGWFIGGGLLFFVLERRLGQSKQESPQLFAMLLDYIPESLALGGMFAVGADSAPLLALLIGLQNLPEGFNSYRELIHGKGSKPANVLFKMGLLVLVGPILAIFGWFYLADFTYLLGAIMLFASGGIFYLIFQDIAPLSRLKKHWFPPLGAVFGFAIALLGKLLIEG